MPDAMSVNLRARVALDVSLGRMTADAGEQLLAIDETITTHHPRQLGGEEPDQAQHWHREGFTDPEVVAWMEAGVGCSTTAALLRRLGVKPSDVAKEYEPDVTIGLALARGLVTIEDVLDREVR